MQSRHEFIEKLIHKYERYVAPFTFILGFVFDALTLKRIDLWFDHIILLFYLSVAATGIIVLNLYETGRLRFKISDSAVPFIPVAIQFAFGGLFSFFIIFYTKSAALGKSWLFILTLVILLVGNERFRKNYQRLVFQLSIFFVVLFSYSIFALPLILKKMSPEVFLLSGLAGLLFLALFVFGLYCLIPQQIKPAGRTLVLSIGGLYSLFNILYFTNVIPPIPLALKEGGIYHSVNRLDSGKYEVTFEPARWQFLFQETNSIYHWKPGEPIYFFSAVFAPTKLDLTILHQWSYYDENKNGWDDYGGVKFPIVGGRDGGYRGYSYRTGIKPGRWRVEVKTEQGQTLNIQTFTVVKSESQVFLKTTLK